METIKIDAERSTANAWLENLQRQIYERLGMVPPASQPFDEAAYRAFIKSSHLGRFGAVVEQDQEKLVDLMVETRRKAFAAVPTQYEEPSLYWMISSFGAQIEQSLAKAGLSLPLKPLFGTVPTGRVNGFAMVVPGTNYRAIMLEDGLFGFANLMCKAVAMAFAGKETDDDRLSFSADWNDVLGALSANPDIAMRFFDALAAYLVGGHPHGAEPYLAPKAATHLGGILRDSMETFVIAHEYGHIVAGHLGQTESRRAMVADLSIDTISTDWMQEFEADAIGLKAMLAVRMSEGYDLALSYWGADAFFSCIDVVEKAVSVLHFGEEQSWEADTHPPTEMRRDMIRLVLLDSVSKKDTKIAEGAINLASIVERIVDHLWTAVRPAFRKLHEEGTRPSSGWKGVAAA